MRGRASLDKAPLGPDAAAPPRVLPRGNVLVLGGVCPVAKREYYENQLVEPLEAAFPPEATAPERPQLFAIPGNHDWSDGLTNFTKIFCQQCSPGNWQTQHRPYFAVLLPPGWWLWGPGIQLAADIGKPQLNYFAPVAEQMPAGSRVVLCTAEPSWLCASHINSQPHHNPVFFQQHIIDKGFELVLTIAGDLHHYARYCKASGVGTGQKTTAGGGCIVPACDGLPFGRAIRQNTGLVMAYNHAKRLKRLRGLTPHEFSCAQ